MGLFEDLNSAGLRAIGLVPQWVDVPAGQYAGAPDGASAGVYLEDSPRAIVYVALRENVAKRTSRVVVTAGDTATTYTVTIDGNAVNTTPATAPVDEVAIEIRNDINADVTVGPLVTASIDPDDATGATVLIVGDAEPDYSIDATVAGGAGTLSFNADASSCDLRLYVTPGGILKSGSTGNPDRWVQPDDTYIPSINYRGFTDRYDVAGYDRIAAELENIAGNGLDGSGITLNVAGIMIGPCVIQAAT